MILIASRKGQNFGHAIYYEGFPAVGRALHPRPHYRGVYPACLFDDCKSQNSSHLVH